ncbi:CRISPR-associated protein Cas5 [Candidatus Aminicenantes bacterium AC-335-K20]|nr:CRISPR-associated protein Cas5 [Candidatus Aminicenantes bacterium AC-335-K20]
MWGVGFKIKSKFGHFRNPYTTTFKQSYPFPPKPTIIGMIGAICGWDEKIVIEKMNKFKIAIPFWNNKGKTIEFICCSK